MLFRPEAFESLTEEGWDEERARIGIRAIVADAEQRFDPVALWPAEEWDSSGSPTPLTGLYCGAAGVIWALDALRRRGHACLLYTSPSPRDRQKSRMPSSA